MINTSFGFAVLKPGEDGTQTLVHFCGYPQKPTAADFDDLKRELLEDPEFGIESLEGLLFKEIEIPWC